MVTIGISREQCSTRPRGAFPESVVEFFRGALGPPYGGFPPAFQLQVPQGHPVPSPSARGDAAAVDLSRRARAYSGNACHAPSTDEDLASYLH